MPRSLNASRVASYRQLAAGNPAAFLPDLAASLNNLSNQRSETGLDPSQSWHTAVNALPALYRGWLRAFYASWLAGNGGAEQARTEMATAVAETTVPAADDPPYAVAAARQHVRATAMLLDPRPDHLPPWATTPIPDPDLAFVNAWLAAPTWPDEETALRTHRAAVGGTTIQTTLDILATLHPGNPDLEHLTALITMIRDHGYDQTITDLRASHKLQATISDWIATPTWPESFSYLQEHLATLRQPHVRQILTQSDEPTAHQHAAILTLTDNYTPEAVRQIVTSPEAAADLAAQAMESADLATMAALLTACPPATHAPGTGPLLLAILTLVAGQPEQAITAAEMAVESCTDIQKRANRIRLNKLLAAGDPNLPPEFKTALKQIIELFTPTIKTPSE